MKAKLFFILIFIATLLAACLKKNNDLDSVESSKIKTVFFSKNRLRDKNIRKSEEFKDLKIISLETTRNNVVRLLFSSPVFYEDEIGKSYKKLFLYFKPNVKGIFIPRTKRILDFKPTLIENNNCELFIPKNLYSIDGSKLKEDLSTDISFNALDDESPLQEQTQTDTWKESKNPPINPDMLSTEIDITTPHKNFFQNSNFHSIERFYKKIEREDIPFVIKNINNPEAQKKYFINKKLTKLPTINAATDTSQENRYIPENNQGLYFCMQKVYLDKKRYNEYFQVYNFTPDIIMGIDTEESVMLFFSKKNKKYKLILYSKSGEIIKSELPDKNNFYRIPNNEYNLIYAYQPDTKLLFSIKLNSIIKNKYKIFSNYNTDSSYFEIYGIIVSAKNGESINNISSKSIYMEITPKNRSTYKAQITNISSKGMFSVKLNKDVFAKKELTVSFFIDNEKIKQYNIEPFEEITDAEVQKNINKNDIITLKDNMIFSDTPASFTLDKAATNKIESIFYTIKKDNKANEEEEYYGNLKNDIKINIPPQEGIYDLFFDIILKNGESISKKFQVNKISENSINQSYTIKDNEIKYTEKNTKITIFNPFIETVSFITLYNNDTHYSKELNLDKGYNTITIKNEHLNAYNLKALIVIFDKIKNNKIYAISDISSKYNNIKNLNCELTEKENALEMKPLPESANLLNQTLYLQITPLQSNINEPIYESLFSFNDFLSSKHSSVNMPRGKRLTISDTKNPTRIAFESLNNLRIDISAFQSNRAIYHCKKNITKHDLINASYIGPSLFYINDSPVFQLSLNNPSKKPIEINPVIKSRNGVIKQSANKLYLKGWETKNIEFSITDFDKDLPIDLLFEIFSEGKMLTNFSKKIFAEKNFIHQSVQITGNLIDNRATTSFLQIPDTEENKYNIELYISDSKDITLLKKNPVIKDIQLKTFELQLLKFLDQYIERKNFNEYYSLDFFDTYHIPNKGYKKHPSDKQISPDATVLFLLAARHIPELYNQSSINRIINNLTQNYKKEILESDFKIFVLAEFGYLFNDVYKKINNAANMQAKMIYYTKYLNKNIASYTKNLVTTEPVYYNNFALPETFIKKLAIYFDNSIQIESTTSCPSLIEEILSKIIFIKNWKTKTTDKKINVSFKSKQLGNFNTALKSNEIIYQKYNFEFTDEGEIDNKYIEFSIEKESSSNLYYIIRAEYKTSPIFCSSNKNFDIYSEWTDYNENILSKEELTLELGKSYFINLFVINNVEANEILIKPFCCDALKIESIMINDKIIDINDIIKDGFIDICSTDKKLNIIKYKIKAMHPGTYNFINNKLVDIYNIPSYLNEKNFYIKIL